ncbi:unnamed protein product [Ascophyllum nodosum]
MKPALTWGPGALSQEGGVRLTSLLIRRLMVCVKHVYV